MRTKTLLLTAALCAAGVASSLAQSVYSVNAVGYVNVTIRPGYNLIANPLNGTNNIISTVLPAAGLPDDTEALTWNNASQGFNQADFVAGGVWYDQGANPSVTVLDPGRAFFLRTTVPTNLQATFVGDVPQGNLTNAISSGYGFYSSIVPQSAGLSSLGFPGNVDMTYLTWNPVAQGYDQAWTYVGVDATYTSGWADPAFAPGDPAPAVAQGFLISNPGAARSWGRTFNVNN
jgi:hypothetical protein